MARKPGLQESADLKARTARLDAQMQKMNATMRQVGQPYQPRMRDPVSGKKLVKGQPVPTAYSKPAKPAIDPDASMPPGAKPSRSRPWLKQAPDTWGNRVAGNVGRMIDPSGGRPLEGVSGEVMRKGRPSDVNYSGDLRSKIGLGINRVADTIDAVGDHIMGGRGQTKPAPTTPVKRGKR